MPFVSFTIIGFSGSLNIWAHWALYQLVVSPLAGYRG